MKTTYLKTFELRSVELSECFNDFILSRRSIHVSDKTIVWYTYTLKSFLKWCDAKALSTPDQISAKDIREFLAELPDDDVDDLYTLAVAKLERHQRNKK